MSATSLNKSSNVSLLLIFINDIPYREVQSMLLAVSFQQLYMHF